MTLGSAGESRTRNDHAVVLVAARREARNRADSRRQRRAVILRAEEGLITPKRMIGVHDAVADAVLEHQLRIDAPLVLAEELEHVAAERRVGTCADLSIGIEVAESDVSDGGLRRDRLT